MAMADYRLCDNCGAKAFYDANLNYEFAEDPDVGASVVGVPRSAKLDYLGDWAVLCDDCAKEYKTAIVRKAGGAK